MLPTNGPYNVFKKLLLIERDIISEHVDIQKKCDTIFRKINCSGSQTLIISSTYIYFARELLGVIQSIRHKYKDAVVWLVGDLNSSSQKSTGPRMLLLNMIAETPPIRLSLLSKAT